MRKYNSIVRKFMESQRNRIITLYRIGKSSREIASIVNKNSIISISSVTIIRYLREWGETIHEKGGARPGSRYGRRKGGERKVPA